MILRPDAVVLPGSEVHSGLEVCIAEGRIAEIRPWSAAARDEAGLLLSPAFVNAHSHLEYFDLLGKIEEYEYWPWIREITRLKPSRSHADVLSSAKMAALENAKCGVTAIGEHSDWPVSGEAMCEARLGGRIFQELITVNEWQSPTQKLSEVEEKARIQSAASGLPVHVNPHASYTVSATILAQFGATCEPISIHVSETEHENALFLRGDGPIREMYEASHVDFEPPGQTAVSYLDDLNCLHSRTQIVHACAITNDDIDVIARRGSTVAHCPRSNIALKCPLAPIKTLRSKGVIVGLGMDSAASAGPIDMFAEMRAAIRVSHERREPLTPDDVWSMATTDAAKSIWLDRDFSLRIGAQPDLALLSAAPLEELIAHGSPGWIRNVIRL